MATDGYENESLRLEDQNDANHLLDDCIFLYSTAEGNPAIRDKIDGSNVIQEYIQMMK